MQKNYTKEFEVHYYEVNRHQEATPAALLNYLEETAICHSESVGLGIQRLQSESVGWVISKWSVHILRHPLWNERVTVETWPSGFERFYATREFLVRDESRNIIARATSLWIFLNTTKRKPARIPQNFGDAYGLNPQRVIDNPFGQISCSMTKDTAIEFSVRRSDIDTNEHVNNVSYVDWMLETIPDEIYENYTLQSIEVEYKKEITFGSSVVSGCQKKRDDNSLCELVHCIFDKNCDLEATLAKSVWKIRQEL